MWGNKLLRKKAQSELVSGTLQLFILPVRFLPLFLLFTYLAISLSFSSVGATAGLLNDPCPFFPTLACLL